MSLLKQLLSLQRKHVSAWLILSICALPGCRLISQQSVYEGIRTQNQQQNQRQDSASRQLPTYQEYEAERNATKTKP